MKVAVMSDGGWGTAISLALLKRNHDVVLWGPFPKYIDEMRESRVNRQFLAGVDLPEALEFTADASTAITGADFIVMAAPTRFARGCLKTIRDAGLPAQARIVSVAKGIENGTLMRVSEMCAELLPGVPYTVLSGPSHAEEVALEIPTAVVAASTDSAMASEVQELFMSDVFRVYTSDDVVGVELGGALKNVFAIAAGVCDGMEFGDNTKAALVTRGIAEMGRLGNALGGRVETFSGLSGLGDMIVTCCSGHSRNRHVGEQLGRGKSLAEITESMGRVVAEGVTTAESAHELAQKVGVTCPIISEIYAGLYQSKDPRQGLRDLMTRAARSEREDFG